MSDYLRRYGGQNRIIMANHQCPEISKAGKISSTARAADGLRRCSVALPQWLVNTALEDGTLIHLLPDQYFPRQGIYGPSDRHVMGQKYAHLLIFYVRMGFAGSTPHH